MGFEREVVEAELALGRIAVEDLPKLARDALESGLGGAATRWLAASDEPRKSVTEKILPTAMEEWRIRAISVEEAGVRIAKIWSRRILAGSDEILFHARDFEELWEQTGYCTELKDCGMLYEGLCKMRIYGRCDEELRKWMRRELERAAEE